MPRRRKQKLILKPVVAFDPPLTSRDEAAFENTFKQAESQLEVAMQRFDRAEKNMVHTADLLQSTSHEYIVKNVEEAVESSSSSAVARRKARTRRMNVDVEDGRKIQWADEPQSRVPKTDDSSVIRLQKECNEMLTVLQGHSSRMENQWLWVMEGSRSLRSEAYRACLNLKAKIADKEKVLSNMITCGSVDFQTFLNEDSEQSEEIIGLVEGEQKLFDILTKIRNAIRTFAATSPKQPKASKLNSSKRTQTIRGQQSSDIDLTTPGHSFTRDPFFSQQYVDNVFHDLLTRYPEALATFVQSENGILSSVYEKVNAKAAEAMLTTQRLQVKYECMNVQNITTKNLCWAALRSLQADTRVGEDSFDDSSWDSLLKSKCERIIALRRQNESMRQQMEERQISQLDTMPKVPQTMADIRRMYLKSKNDLLRRVHEGRLNVAARDSRPAKPAGPEEADIEQLIRKHHKAITARTQEKTAEMLSQEAVQRIRERHQKAEQAVKAFSGTDLALDADYYASKVVIQKATLSARKDLEPVRRPMQLTAIVRASISKLSSTEQRNRKRLSSIWTLPLIPDRLQAHFEDTGKNQPPSRPAKANIQNPHHDDKSNNMHVSSVEMSNSTKKTAEMAIGQRSEMKPGHCKTTSLIPSLYQRSVRYSETSGAETPESFTTSKDHVVTTYDRELRARKYRIRALQCCGSHTSVCGRHQLTQPGTGNSAFKTSQTQESNGINYFLVLDDGDMQQVDDPEDNTANQHQVDSTHAEPEVFSYHEAHKQILKCNRPDTGSSLQEDNMTSLPSADESSIAPRRKLLTMEHELASKPISNDLFHHAFQFATVCSTVLTKHPNYLRRLMAKSRWNKIVMPPALTSLLSQKPSSMEHPQQDCEMAFELLVRWLRDILREVKRLEKVQQIIRKTIKTTENRVEDHEFLTMDDERINRQKRSNNERTGQTGDEPVTLPDDIWTSLDQMQDERFAFLDYILIDFDNVFRRFHDLHNSIQAIEGHRAND